MSQPQWEITASKKRAQLSALIPRKWTLDSSDISNTNTLRDVTLFIHTFLNAQELEITESSASEILSNVASDLWTSVEIVEAFCHRAAVAHQLVNCLSEILFDAALAQAKLLDTVRSKFGRTIGPLHGLPVSLKDKFRVEGAETAAGYIGWLGPTETAASESLLVRNLKCCGAIPFVKTNVPMSLLYLSAGGASGGEGALLALRGAPLGWGSDIAINLADLLNRVRQLPGLPTGHAVIGPLSPYLDSIELSMKAILELRPWRDDIEVIELPWRNKSIQSIRERSGKRVVQGSLTFGVMHWDGLVRPHPPVQRAVDLVVDALKEQGHEVVLWEPPPHGPATEILYQLFGSTGGHAIREALRLSGEPPIPQLQTWFENDDTGSLPTASRLFLGSMQTAR
ncbi:hypothetical protein MMC28_003980 [Mycoblastus sanguinarius]|nr:hypothetical protein [Mycoblastus sanguinarius]